MGEHDEFLRWVDTRLKEAEVALHDGDAGPRRALWSDREPVPVFGAWRTAAGQREGGEWKVVHRHADTLSATGP